MMQLEDLGVIGNCQYSAHVSAHGEIVWCCMPRFDSEPIFGSLLDPQGGGFRVAPVNESKGTLRYLDNTNVLETTFESVGGKFRVIDFAPRFLLYDRMFRPTKLVRILEPIEGSPMVRITCNPVRGWSKTPAQQSRGSNHISFDGYSDHLRLTTDVPLSSINGEPFALTGKRYLLLSWGEPVAESLSQLCERFYHATVEYWRQWVKQTSIPSSFQREVIRSALCLKLHCFEDTGAIVAALTTSLPEHAGSGRTWDYRYCWLRDAYYALSAFRLLGHFEEREHFTNYLLTVAQSSHELDLAPLFRIDGGPCPPEVTIQAFIGADGHGPVRDGNSAVLQKQHDVFGEIALAIAPVFMDERFFNEATDHTLDMLVNVARRALYVAGRPDSGIWEYRRHPEVQTFSSMMCWAGADRVRNVCMRRRPTVAAEIGQGADRLRQQIIDEAWSEKMQAFTASHKSHTLDLDASLLQMVPLRFLSWEDPRLRSTVDVIRKALSDGHWLYRYRNDDGLGLPSTSFVICTFWMIEALVRTGRQHEAREVLTAVLSDLPALGLIAEDFDPKQKRMWGNYPQAYSHVGLIHAAFAASTHWAEVL